MKSKFSAREWWTMAGIGSVNFCAALCISLQAPFYPAEAESKGASATEYGFVFGVYELVGFMLSPIYGKYIDAIGATFMLRSGIFVTGFTSILFGTLDVVNGHMEFIALSFAVRITEALGSAAILTASFSIVATMFPDNVATVFATLETLFGLGTIVGPTIGGLLFTVGGFQLPFFVVGAVLLLECVFIWFVLPSIEDGCKSRPRAQLLAYVRLPPVMLDMLSVVTASVAAGFLSAVLEPHVRQFHISPLSTGLVFVIMGATYALLAPLVGRLCDKHVNPKYLLLIGFVLGVVAFMMIGPIPYTPLQPQLWLVCVGMVVNGVSNALLIVPAYIDAIRSSVSAGLPDDISTYGVVSGLWGSAYALGSFIGPSVAGALYDAVGFRPGTLFIVAFNTVMLGAMTTYLCTAKRRQQRPLCRDVTLLDSSPPEKNGYGTLTLCTAET